MKENNAFNFSEFLIYFVYTVIVVSLVHQNLLFINSYATKLSTNLPPHLRTAWAPFDSNYLDVLERCCEWRVTSDPYNATILWTRSGPQEVNPSNMRLGHGQLYSLVEDTDVMTDKSELHKLLVQINASHLQPETYVLSNQKECRQFFMRADEHPDIVWVTKEPGASQGEGIVVNPSVEELKKTWLVDASLSKDQWTCVDIDSDGDRVAQRYIRNPLLLNGKKMEIRSYWLIVSLHPYVVYYHDGTVRLTTNDYKDEDWDNPLIHITNTRQQKLANPNYYETESERKWTLEQLASYLYDNNRVTNATNWLDNTLRPYLKHIIKTVAEGAWPHMMRHKSQPGWDGRFELLGMDVILDDTLHPWLTEIQMGPGISLDPGVKEKVLPNMLQEMTDLVLEVDSDLRAGRPLAFPLRSAEKWEPIPVRTGGGGGVPGRET
eukprot:TRINITY_DN213_c0_g5_i1.p1 TRINITY_DN213_c0_g5~~TRINITY_DN213_c0_g5_i1.p1  ORF type:complete len:435 (+),score=82.91 TRINITY_DN213_c0_g5_i1:78-1382(+)